MTNKKTIPTTNLSIIGIILFSVFVIGFAYDLPAVLEQALNWVKDQGIIGYFVFISLYIFACVFFIPGTVLTLGAGAIYGVIKGSILVSVASTLGASAAFLVGRYAARSFVEKKIEGNQSFSAIDNAVAKEGWKIVFLTRLSPLFPFNLLNYMYGLTKVSFLNYLTASWIGMMPGTVMYVYIGSLSGDLATLGINNAEQSIFQWILKVIGFAATVIVTFYVTLIARNALKSKVEESAEPPNAEGTLQ